MINVACAVILDERGEVLAAQRSSLMVHPLKWEFPGGKVEEGETPEFALHREILEELGIEIEVLRSLPSTTFEYSTSRIVCLMPFVCCISKGQITLAEHKQYVWVKPEELFKLDWVEADLPIVAAIKAPF